MIFPDASIDALSGDSIYDFPVASPVYQGMLEYLTGFFEFSSVRQVLANGSDEEKADLIWRILNESWWLFGRVNSEVPVRWTALAKRMLEVGIIPSNVYEYCKAIIGNFDLQRYQLKYQLPDYDYHALVRDLPLIKQLLQDFPRAQLMPPIPELQWEDHDCIPPV